MTTPDYVIVGAGPAGAALAGILAERGYTVRVLDASKPGMKPCGWAVPSLIEQVVHIPREAVLTEIRGYRVYLGGRLVHEGGSSLWGYIVDKPRFLEALLSPAELVKQGVRIKPTPEGPVLLEKPKAREGIVLATGSQAYASPGDRPRWADMIYAVQALIPWRPGYSDETIEMYFEPSLVGYYWVFPRPGIGLDIGVGGYEHPPRLIERLKHFAKKLGLGEPREIRGAWINIGGAQPRLLERPVPVIGEAAGYVYPISGEGIRPSIVSAAALASRLTSSTDTRVEKLHRETVKWINIQRKLLDKAVKTSPEARARLLEALPEDVFTAIGLGTLSLTQLLRALPRLPRAIAALLKTALTGREGET